MEVNTYECDICRAPKKDEKGWYKGYLLDRNTNNTLAGILLIQFDVNSITQPFMLKSNLPKSSDSHLCGVECAQKWIAQQMAVQP